MSVLTQHSLSTHVLAQYLVLYRCHRRCSAFGYNSFDSRSQSVAASAVAQVGCNISSSNHTNQWRYLCRSCFRDSFCETTSWIFMIYPCHPMPVMACEHFAVHLDWFYTIPHPHIRGIPPTKIEEFNIIPNHAKSIKDQFF